jgi:hypothetical protein
MRFRNAASMLAVKTIGCIGLVFHMEHFVVANLYGQLYTYIVNDTAD